MLPKWSKNCQIYQKGCLLATISMLTQKALIIVFMKAVTHPYLLNSLTYIHLSRFRIDLIPDCLFIKTFLYLFSISLAPSFWTTGGVMKKDL